ncbi:hypothetical protein [Natrinema salinisoli]|uniref:hypothetical protein n=1 Tax=Natrinema salinisoli TaxID=2878535 RepID=UPI001CEFF777|nr:hypothetical protein [Natrinema salinisoli]
MDSSPSRGPEDVISRWDEVFTALSAEPRRQIVDALIDVPPGEPVSLPETAASANGGTDFDRLRLQLQHRHLPLLEANGFVQWESDPLRAYRGRDFEEVAIVLESLYANAEEIPDRLVVGCQTLEYELESGNSGCELSG